MLTKDKRILYNREYNERKHDEIIEQKKEYRQMIRNEVISLMGSKCKNCGFEDGRALSVIGIVRGKEEGYTTYWNRLFQEVSNGNKAPFLLCANCKELV